MKKKLLAIFLLVLIALPCIWRLWPHSLNRILDANGEAFDAIAVQVSEFGISDGSPKIDVYRLDIPSRKDANYDSFMSVLQSTEFRQDFRNLLPWNILSVGSGQDSITHSAYILLEWGGGNTCYISFHGDRIVSFDISGETEYRIYHPADRATLNRIVTYVKEHGALQG